MDHDSNDDENSTSIASAPLHAIQAAYSISENVENIVEHKIELTNDDDENDESVTPSVSTTKDDDDEDDEEKKNGYNTKEDPPPPSSSLPPPKEEKEEEEKSSVLFHDSFLSSFNSTTLKYMKDVATPFFRDLANDLAATQPTDPQAFFAEKLKNMIDKVNIESESTKNNLFTDGSANFIVTETGEKIEADTGDYNLPINALIFPSGVMPVDDTYSKVSVSYSSSLLGSWLKQPGPCCCATSIAGALNSLNGLKRSDASAIDTFDVITILRSTLESQIERKKSTFERRVGAKVEPLIDALEKRLAVDNKTLGGRKALGATSKEVMAYVKEIVMSAEFPVDPVSGRVISDESAVLSGNGDIIRELRALYEAKQTMIVTSDSSNNIAIVETPVATPSSATTTTTTASATVDENNIQTTSDETTTTWKWRKPLNHICGKLSDVCRLNAEPTNQRTKHLRKVATERLEKLQRPFERRIGHSIKPLLDELIEYAKKEGRPLGTPKETAPTARECMRMIRILVCTMEPDVLQTKAPIFHKLRTLYENDEGNVGRLSLSISQESIGGDDDDDDSMMRVTSPTPTTNDDSVPRPKSSSSSRKRTVWTWKSDLQTLLSKIGGLRKLARSRPSTGAFGTWAINSVIKRYSDASNTSAYKYTTEFLMAIKRTSQKVLYPVRRRDDIQAIETQWAGLRTAFNEPDCVIIFHLKNHYAPIYALREFERREPNGAISHVRELLTARKGQRPSAWIPFLEARQTLLSWAGHALVKIMRKPLSTKRRSNSMSATAVTNSTVTTAAKVIQQDE